MIGLYQALGQTELCETYCTSDVGCSGISCSGDAKTESGCTDVRDLCTDFCGDVCGMCQWSNSSSFIGNINNCNAEAFINAPKCCGDLTGDPTEDPSPEPTPSPTCPELDFTDDSKDECYGLPRDCCLQYSDNCITDTESTQCTEDFQLTCCSEITSAPTAAPTCEVRSKYTLTSIVIDTESILSHIAVINDCIWLNQREFIL